jgi:isovaleryl-CoA dehydrogenase
MQLWTEEQELLAKSVGQFAKKELEPYASKLDETEDWNKQSFPKMAELGILGVTVSDELGGAGLGCTEATLIMEKLAECCASTTLSYLAHSILCVNNISENASQKQKEKYIPKLINGEHMGAMAMTEPGSGSDALSMSTKAEKKGKKYILNGTKTFITNGPVADVLVVYAKTGPDKKNLSTFIIEKNFPGFKVGKKLKKMGMRASPTSELIFENCEVPEENLVGKENDSVSHMMKNLNIERITISGISIGLASAALEYAIQYAQERAQFGKTLYHFQMIQDKIAVMSTKLEAARALTYSAANQFDKGTKDMTLGAHAKLFSAEIATQVCLESIQILGGYGYMKEYPVERYMRDAKLIEIGAGTNEVMKMIIAKEKLKLKDSQ